MGFTTGTHVYHVDKALLRLNNLSDQGTFTPVDAQEGGFLGTQP